MFYRTVHGTVSYDGNVAAAVASRIGDIEDQTLVQLRESPSQDTGNFCPQACP